MIAVVQSYFMMTFQRLNTLAGRMSLYLQPNLLVSLIQQDIHFLGFLA